MRSHSSSFVYLFYIFYLILSFLIFFTIPDLDGDGIDDIVVGADGDDDGNTKGHDEGKQAAYGAVFVVFLNKLGRASASRPTSVWYAYLLRISLFRERYTLL